MVILMKKIGEGAEAVVYYGKFLGRDAIVKDRVKKGYRIPEIDGEIRLQRTRREAKILGVASGAGINVPRVLLAAKTKIFMSKIDGIGMAGVMRGEHDIPGGMLERAIYDAGRAAGALHNSDIAHGDYTPANLIIDHKGRLWVIDFGLAAMTKSVEEKALDLLLMKRSLEKALFQKFMDGYRTVSKGQVEIIDRLKEIERRGRYQSRTLLPG